MSIHLEPASIKCKICSADFIPYKKSVKCPKCGRLISLPADWDFGFIQKIAETMEYHKDNYGSFTPPAWYTGSFTEAAQINIYRIFDTIEHDNPENPKDHIKKLVGMFKYGEGDEYLKKHLEDLALAVYDIYKTDKNLSRKVEKKKPAPVIEELGNEEEKTQDSILSKKFVLIRNKGINNSPYSCVRKKKKLSIIDKIKEFVMHKNNLIS